MSFYPDQRLISSLSLIQRETRLPEAAQGTVQAVEGRMVDVRDKVLRGMIPNRHYILEAAQELRLNNPEDLKGLMLVKERTRIEAGTPIAGRDAKRGRRVFAPVDGIILFVGRGRIIMQAMPEIFDMEAGVRGTVSRIYPNQGLLIETTGAILQGVWGNDLHRIANLRMEPSGGIDSIVADSLDLTYKGEIIVTARPLSVRALDIGKERNFAGIIAPSMSASLLPAVQAAEFAIMLTEGFGNIPMSETALSLLREFDSYQAVIDAYRPRRESGRRPELVINRTSPDVLMPINATLSLARGMKVRCTRAPHLGMIGKVADLPRSLMKLPNGLRVPCATVELGMGEVVQIPLANLEVVGR